MSIQTLGSHKPSSASLTTGQAAKSTSSCRGTINSKRPQLPAYQCPAPGTCFDPSLAGAPSCNTHCPPPLACCRDNHPQARKGRQRKAAAAPSAIREKRRRYRAAGRVAMTQPSLAWYLGVARKGGGRIRPLSGSPSLRKMLDSDQRGRAACSGLSAHPTRRVMTIRKVPYV